MSWTDEQIILDPSEVADTDRDEFDLTPWIAPEGIDWGDAEIAAYTSESTRGEYPIDYRIGNRVVTGPLVFHEAANQSGVAQAARAAVQAKLALFQMEGGWIKRITNSGTEVFADVVGASFHATSTVGWASGQDLDPTASFSLSLIPDFYGDEVSLGTTTETTDIEMIWTESGILGDYPARMRMVISEDQGANQGSVIFGFRARSYDAAAPLAYEAEAMSLNSGTSNTGLTGASGGNVARRTATTSFVYTTLKNVTLVGSYRLFGRFHCNAGSAVEVRAVWMGSRNTPVEISSGNVFSIVDLGGATFPAAPAGRSVLYDVAVEIKGASGGEVVDFDKLWFVPTHEAASGLVRAVSFRPTYGPTYPLPSGTDADLSTVGYFSTDGTNAFELPVYGNLPRLPVSAAGIVECFIKASRGEVGDATHTPTSDAGIDNISATLFYRPSYLFVP